MKNMKKQTRQRFPIAGAAFLLLAGCSRAPHRVYSEDERHRVFQAAAKSHDASAVLRATREIGVSLKDNDPTFAVFEKEHFQWAMQPQNGDFVEQMKSPEAAVRYLKETTGIVADPSRDTIPAAKSDAGDGKLAGLPEREKHRLLQASAKADDPETALRVIKALGFHGEDRRAAYDQFIKAHKSWGQQDFDFVQQMKDVNKARSYVKAHLP